MLQQHFNYVNKPKSTVCSLLYVACLDILNSILNPSTDWVYKLAKALYVFQLLNLLNYSHCMVLLGNTIIHVIVIDKLDDNNNV